MGMNPNEGRLVTGDAIESWMTTYTLGEVVKVKNEEFRVVEIAERRLVLEPIAQQPGFIDAIRDALGTDSLKRHERRRQEALERKAK